LATSWAALGAMACIPGGNSAHSTAEAPNAVGQGSGAATDELPPFVADGEPFSAPDGVWTWIDFPDSFCRDGSTSGLLVSLASSSDELMIFLDGGGACFDLLSCKLADAAAPKHPPKSAGLFDRTNPQNPVRSWNFVYVPYCTGDVHAGTNPHGKVAGVSGVQRFVGRLNLEAFLQRIVPTFAHVGRVLLTGTSAGGFGAAASAILVQRAFSKVKVATIDDSGPPLSGADLAPCLQAKWRDLWGLDGSMLADCGTRCPNRDDFVFDYAQYWAELYQDRSSGLIESTHDSVISAFFGPGTLDCHGSLLTPLLPRKLEAGLLEFRDALGDLKQFGTYYPDSRQHTWLGDDSFYSYETGGVSMRDWVTRIVEDERLSNQGP
jgi:hypothetical protein